MKRRYENNKEYKSKVSKASFPKITTERNVISQCNIINDNNEESSSKKFETNESSKIILPHDIQANKKNKNYLNPHLITEDMEKYYFQNKQSVINFQKKRELQTHLYNIINQRIPGIDLFLFGSSMSGFGTNSSDLDLCLALPNSKNQNKILICETLSIIRGLLKRAKICFNALLIRAKVPILKFRYIPSAIECDLNVNNTIGVRNTYLLESYSRIDSRLCPLIHYVKYWARKHNINDASRGLLSSYSITLMVIGYLQAYCSPNVLPSLQILYPDHFDPNRDLQSFESNDPPLLFQSNNKQTLGQLFIGFIDFFATKFNFEREAISIRLARVIDRSVVETTEPSSQWKYICIEEPFNLSNVSRSVYNEIAFESILRAFKKTHRAIQVSKSLNDIFNPYFNEFHL